MTTTINADTVTGGAVVTADASGVLGLQAAGNTGITLNSSRAIGVGASPSYGTSGQVLTSAGSAAAPTWSTVSLPGATAVGSVCMLTQQYGSKISGGGNNYSAGTFAFNGYSDPTSGSFSVPLTIFNASGTYFVGKPVYSSYHSLWMCAFRYVNSSAVISFGWAFSKNGVNWTFNSLSSGGFTATAADPLSLAVNSAGTIQILYSASSALSVIASTDNGVTWSQATVVSGFAYAAQSFNTSIGTNFYVINRGANGVNFYNAYVFSSDGVTNTTSTLYSNLRNWVTFGPHAVSSGAVYYAQSYDGPQLQAYITGSNTQGEMTSAGSGITVSGVAVSSTHLAFSSTSTNSTIYYTSTLNSLTVTWTALNLTSTIGSSVSVWNIAWTGNAWLLFTTSSSVVGGNVWYNTNANPATGTFAKVPYLNFSEDTKPNIGNSVIAGCGIGVRAS